MTSRNERRRRIKGRQTTNPFLMLPFHVLNHERFASLSPRATKLVIDIASQYRGNNNGDLCAPLSVMRRRGWTSSDQLHKAKSELIEKGVIILTRQGGLNKANLYALSWLPIDECYGKLDVAATALPPVTWKTSLPSPWGGSKDS